MADSALTRIKQLEVVVQGVLRKQDAQDLPRECQKIMAELKRDLTDARMDIRDSEYADTGEEYKRHATEGKKRIVRVNKAILALSSYDMFGPVEVAELSAKLEQIAEDL